VAVLALGVGNNHGRSAPRRRARLATSAAQALCIRRCQHYNGQRDCCGFAYMRGWRLLGASALTIRTTSNQVRGETERGAQC
jgi:hypothetical protein